MPGMSAKQLQATRRNLPTLEYVKVESARTLEDFRGIGSLCFHVPMDWFAEVFENQMLTSRPRFRCYVAYLEGVPVATAATVRTGSFLGIYNVATAPGHRRRGIAEAMTRYLIENSEQMEGVVLQSTAHGFRLYERIGFRSVTRILVYNSMP
jgi:ribosomal protein S18 acetylase RimI-like enzyme